MAGTGRVRVVVTAATRIIAICGTCGKKLGGGFGDGARRPLGKVLRRCVTGAKGKRATLNVVVVIDSAQPEAMLIVACGTAIETVCSRLVLPLA